MLVTAIILCHSGAWSPGFCQEAAGVFGTKVQMLVNVLCSFAPPFTAGIVSAAILPRLDAATLDKGE
jgi:hypothetical protein